MVGIVNLCSAIGRVSSGQIGDKVGFLNALLGCMTTATGFLFYSIFCLCLHPFDFIFFFFFFFFCSCHVFVGFLYHKIYSHLLCNCFWFRVSIFFNYDLNFSNLIFLSQSGRLHFSFTNHNC